MFLIFLVPAMTNKRHKKKKRRNKNEERTQKRGQERDGIEQEDNKQRTEDQDIFHQIFDQRQHHDFLVGHRCGQSHFHPSTAVFLFRRRLASRGTWREKEKEKRRRREGSEGSERRERSKRREGSEREKE